MRQQLTDALDMLKARGIIPHVDSRQPEEQHDYIEHGSPEHAALLGLVEVPEDDKEIRLGTFTSPQSERTYALVDEQEALRVYPGVEPDKSVRLLLQQKVRELENKPTVPEDAPSMFQPGAVYPA